MEKKNLYAEIACAAYELYEKRGRAHGYELADWLEAERIVMARHGKEIEKEARAIKATRAKHSPAEPKTAVTKPGTGKAAVKSTAKTEERAAEPKKRTTKKKTE